MNRHQNARSRLHRDTRGSAYLVVIILLASVTGLIWSKESLRKNKTIVTVAAEEPPLYLPDTRYVKLVTFGFDNVVSDLLWFDTMSYFGKQFRGDQDYRWLGHRCSLVAGLDPNAHHVFEFCATMLSWVAKNVELSNEILSHAIKLHPKRWRYLYLRAFNYWYFLEQKNLAQHDFETASKLEGAPPFLASLASRFMVAADDPKTAISFLQDLINNTSDPIVKEALTEKLKLAQLSSDLKNFANAIERFQLKHKTEFTKLSQLVDVGIMRGLPLDPYGGTYSFDASSGKVKSTSGKTGLEYFGRTAKTGIARKEFQD